jgi:hypothetical protein
MQDFQKIYAAWTDAQLIAAYRKPEDYHPAARDAMRNILQARGLLAAEEAETRRVAAEQLLQNMAEQRSAQERYEQRMLGTSIDDAQFAAQALQADGTYLTFAVHLRKRQRLMYLPLTLAILCIVTCFLPVDMQHFPMQYRLIAACGAIITGALAAVSFASSRMEVSLQADGNGGIQLAWSSEDSKQKLSHPLKYSFGAELKPIGNGISVPHLVGRFVDVEGRSLVIEELLTALQSCPPSWPRVIAIGATPNDAVEMVVLSGKRPVLVHLKKILDGLRR